jgi:mannose-6-phosphate isomerase-like protein (cupin superfamily)
MEATKRIFLLKSLAKCVGSIYRNGSIYTPIVDALADLAREGKDGLFMIGLHRHRDNQEIFFMMEGTGLMFCGDWCQLLMFGGYD